MQQKRQPGRPGEHLYPVVRQLLGGVWGIDALPYGGNKWCCVQIAAEMDLLGGFDQIHRLLSIEQRVVQPLQQLQRLLRLSLIGVSTGENDFYPLLLNLVAHFQHTECTGHRVFPGPEILHGLQKPFAPLHTVGIVILVPASGKQGIFNIKPGIHGLREQLLSQLHPLLQLRQLAGVRRIDRIAQNRWAKALPAVHLSLDQPDACTNLIEVIFLQAAAFYHLQTYQEAVRTLFQLVPQKFDVSFPLLRSLFRICP